jgi:cell wall-associated NlpC family hydrolase
LLVLGFAASMTASVAAQTNNSDDRPRYSVKKTVAVTPKVSEAAPATESATTTSAKAPSALALAAQFHDQMLAALESHVGSSYHWNTTGPNTFDCSGLVWRAFQDIGINFQRGPARSYWATFAAPAKGDEFKFGNMVFFSGLKHVGIVVDEKGFYHSARHGGVMYSPFNDYWLSRIDGFRRVPLIGLPTTPEKRLVKPTAIVPIAEDLNPR